MKPLFPQAFDVHMSLYLNFALSDASLVSSWREFTTERLAWAFYKRWFIMVPQVCIQIITFVFVNILRIAFFICGNCNCYFPTLPLLSHPWSQPNQNLSGCRPETWLPGGQGAKKKKKKKNIRNCLENTGEMAVRGSLKKFPFPPQPETRNTLWKLHTITTLQPEYYSVTFGVQQSGGHFPFS